MLGRYRIGVIVGLALVLGSCGGHAVKPAALNQYTVAGACTAIRSPALGRFVRASAAGAYTASARTAGRAEPFHLQATALGTDLLYGARREFALPGPAGQLASAATPSNAAVWRVRAAPGGRFTLTSVTTHQVLAASGASGTLALADPTSAGTSALFSFQRARGCAGYPEASVSASGTTFRGAAPMSAVSGTIDAHAHATAFEFFGGSFHCGRPWDRFGVAYALPDCASIQPGTGGEFAVVQNFLDFGDPFHQHDTRGWPTFVDWPGPTRLSYEGDYYMGIKRAWMAGLRVMVTQYVDNEALCFVMTLHRCDDMASVRRQNRDLHALQDYIDAQSGGPGKGWFRIVTDPFQARQVINEGKLAVIEGIEVSDVLGCGERGRPACTRARVNARLGEIQNLGVRSFFPIHKFDNAVGGTTMDDGALGLLIDTANRYMTGHFWDVRACPGGPRTLEHDRPQLSDTKLDPVLRFLLHGAFSVLGPGAPIAHVNPPHCNHLGLQPIGAYLINQMIKRHLIVELDHMDVRTGNAALRIIEQHHYSGVVSAHSFDTPDQNQRIYATGGFVTPSGQGVPGGFVAQWRIDRADPRTAFSFGFGYGSDFNGLAAQDQPTDGRQGGKKIPYPFKSFDGRVTFGRERWGNKIFDLNTMGLANYGMYADWLEAVRVNAGTSGKAIMSDMFHGAEAYLQMWERAYGVPPPHCLSPSQPLVPGGLGRAIQLGDTPERLLLRTGQPSSRPGRSYRYCLEGVTNSTKASAVFTASGTVGLIANSGSGASAAGFAVGSPAAGLHGHARSVGSGLWVGPQLTGGARYVYRVSSGRITLAAVAAPSATHTPALLRQALRAGGFAV